MAEERKTIITYRGDGVQTVYAFPMDYLKKSFIKVMFDGLPVTYGVDYVVVNRQVEFTVAPPLDTIIVIYRATQTDRMVAWEDASVLRASDMTVFEMQLLHLSEEVSDKVQDSGMVKDPEDGIWDARFTRMKNLADPINAGDVMNRRYFESTQAGFIQANQALVGQAVAAKDLAALSANEAEVSKTNAKSSELAAKTSETNAKASELVVKTSEDNAKASELAAKTSEDNAKASEVIATDKVAEVTNVINGATIHVPTFPVGVPFPWFNSVFPDGTLECRGQAFDTLAYPDLALIYPSGILPDLRGVVLRGLNRGSGRDVDGASRTAGSYQEDEFKSHKHSLAASLGHTDASLEVSTGFAGWSNGFRSYTNGTTPLMMNAGGSESRMKNVACYWLVYASKQFSYDLNVNNGNALTLGGYPASHFAISDHEHGVGDYTIVYPNGGSKSSPANVSVNSRYENVIPSGFEGHELLCKAEILVDGKWGETGTYNAVHADGILRVHGVQSFHFNGKIITVTGLTGLLTASSSSFNPFNYTTTLIAPTPCRVKVYKLARVVV